MNSSLKLYNKLYPTEAEWGHRKERKEIEKKESKSKRKKRTKKKNLNKEK